MKHIKIMGLCLTALFMINVAAANTALAAETLEFRVGTSGRKEFSSTGGVVKFETEAGTTVECKKETDSAEAEERYRTTKISKILISYKECKSILGSCKSPGANAEEIKTFSLLARLGWISNANSEVGLLYNPETGRSGNPNNLLAEFECNTLKVRVRGSVIGRITPIDANVGPSQITKTFKFVFAKGTGVGKQAVTKFEGEPENKLEINTGTEFVDSAIEGTSEFFPLGSLEIET